MRGEQDPSWTDERIALLQQLWADGVPASAIGAQLRVSRSAVLGKINRLRRLASNAGPSKAGQPNTTLLESAASDIGALHGPPPPALRRRGKRGDRSESPHAKAKARGKGLLDLTNNCCRRPLGKPGTATFGFCGASEADLELGIPYCKRHMKRAYLAPRHAIRKTKPGVVPAGAPPSAPPNTTGQAPPCGAHLPAIPLHDGDNDARSELT
jgi:GcrA cell cycle regulator